MSKFIDTLKLNFDSDGPGDTGSDPGKPEKPDNKQKRRLYFSIGLGIIMALAAFAVYRYFENGRNGDLAEADPAPRSVSALTVDKAAVYSDAITTVGSVRAGLSVDAVSLARGTVRNLHFSVGDAVEPGRLLAQLQNDATAVNYSNAQINYSNALNSYEITRQTADKTVEQAALGVANAAAAVESAAVGVKTARDNLANIESILKKGNDDAKDQAVIAFYDFLNTMNGALDQVNLLIEADIAVRNRDLENVLGVKDSRTLPAARLEYLAARRSYTQLFALNPDRETVITAFASLAEGLEETKRTIDRVMEVLDNTITSAVYGGAWLNAQKTNFSALRGSLVGAQSRAAQTKQSLDNLSLSNQRERDQLENALAAALKQQEIAEIAYENARVAAAAAENARAQQLNAARSSVDSARGQVGVLGTQVSDLSVRSPIRGVVTRRYVEAGAEVNPGQKIAEIAQLETAVIEVNLPSEQIYRIAVGAEAVLEGEYRSRITLIDPAADPITKKVRLEISYDNRGRELLPGTFVNVAIPAKELRKTGPDSVFIPLRALNLGQTESYVYTVVDGRAEPKPVSPGKVEGALVEILSGLSDGELLIVDGAKEVFAGEAVTIR